MTGSTVHIYIHRNSYMYTYILLNQPCSADTLPALAQRELNEFKNFLWESWSTRWRIRRCRVHILKFHICSFDCTLIHTNAASVPPYHGRPRQISHRNIIRIVLLLSVIAPLMCCPQQKTDMSRMMRRTGVQGNRFGRVCATKHMNTG